MRKILALMLLLLLAFTTVPTMAFVTAQPSDWIPLTTYSDGDGYPNFSPDGNEIAFVRSRSDHWHRDIWIMDADGLNEEMVVEDSPWGGGVGWPDWSPDGTKIAYARYYDNYRSDIEIVDRDTLEITVVVEDFGPNQQPKWSHF